MVKIRDYQIDALYSSDEDIDSSYRIYTGKLKEGEKISIVSDSMFKTVFLDSRRIQISAFVLSLIIDNTFEEILANLRFTKNDLDKDNNTKKGLKSDYVATLDNSIINIEVNNNGSMEILRRNTEYLNRLYASKLSIGSEYLYQQCLQLNINNFAIKGFEDTIEYVYKKNQYNQVVNDDIIQVNIYLPNIRKKCYNQGKESLTKLERFILALSEKNKDYCEDLVRGDNFMEKMINEIEELCLSDDMLCSYDKEETNLKFAKKEGIEQKEKEDAINFHKNGAADEMIIKSLGITQEKLKEYLNSENKKIEDEKINTF